MRHAWVTYLPGASKPPLPTPVGPSPPLGKILTILLVCLALYPILDNWVGGFTSGNVLVGLAVYTSPPVCYIIGLLLIAGFLPASWVRGLRQSPIYQGIHWLFKRKLAPLFSAFGISLLAFGIVYHVFFNIADSFGAICTETVDEAHSALKSNASISIPFDTGSGVAHLPSDRCVSTGVYVKAYARYRVSVVRDPEQWSFFGEPSYMGGQPVSRLPWYKELTMAALYPLRRTLDRPWGAFVLRIGGKGSEEDFLDRNPPEESDNIRAGSDYYSIPAKETLGEVLTPKREGELFMYLNKPTIRWLGNWIGNTGKATVKIEELS